MAKNNDQDDFQDENLEQMDDSYYEDQDDSPEDDGESAEWDEGEPSSSSTKSGGKKKTSLSTILIVAGGVIVGLAILYFQFVGGGGGSTVPSEELPAPPPGVASVPESSPVAPVVPAPQNVGDGISVPASPSSPSAQTQDGAQGEGAVIVTEKAAEGGGGAPSLEALRDTNSTTGIETVDSSLASGEPKKPGDSSAKKGFMNDPSLLPAEIQGEAVLHLRDDGLPGGDKKPQNPVTPVSDFPTADDIKKPEVTFVEEKLPSPVSVEAAPAPVSTSASLAPSEDVVKLQDKLDAALRRIEELEQKAAVQPSEAPAPDSDSASEKEIASLRQALSALQEKVDAMAAEAEKSMVQQQAPVAQIPAKVERSERRSHSRRAVSAPSSNVSKSRGAVSSRVLWELRGASPGQAVLSAPGEQDARMVRLGDSVPGLGRITSIENTDSGWLVTGTQGQLRQ